MDAIFVGRGSELARLDAVLERAATGFPSAILIEGPAGAGKSALLDRFAARAEDVVLVRASGDDNETAIAYGVCDQVLERLVLPDDGSGRPRRRPPSGSLGDLQATGELLHERLRTAAAGRRCVVAIIDDAHLADRASLATLGYALRRLQTEPIMTVLATRPEGTAALPRGLLALLDADGARIAVPGLSVAEVRDLAAQYGHREVGERAARRLREHTGGSPLHLRALLQDSRLGEGAWLSAPLPAPVPFARLVAAQLQRLSPEARSLVAAAAVLGLRCDLGAAAEMARVTEPLTAADELRTVQIAGVERSRRGPELVFDHSVIRAAVLQDSSEADLAAAHRAAAEVTDGAEALFHRAKATIGRDLELAKLLEQQARADIAHGGWRTAANALLEAAGFHPADADRDTLLARGVYALLVAGDLAVADTYRAQVAELPATARQLQVRALMAWMTGDFAAAESLAERAWRFADDLEPPERDRLAGLLAQMFIMQGKSQAALAWSRTALDSGLLDSGGRASTLATLVGAMLLEGRTDEAMALLPTEGDLNDAGYRELVGMRGLGQLVSDDPTSAAANLRIRLRPNLVDHRRGQSPIELLTATGPEGIEPNKLVILLLLADAEFRRGSWDVAAAIAEQALGLIEDTEQYWIEPWAHAIAVLVPASRGRWEVAEAHLGRAEEAATRFGGELNRGYAANAAVHLASCRGDAERVVASARWLLEHGKPFHAEPGLHCWPVHYAEALVSLGRHAEAERVLGRWEATAQQRGRRSRIAALARVRGDLAVRQRDLSAARRAYQMALDAARGELTACGIDPEQEAASARPLPSLTPQEGAVARLVFGGRSNKEIAEVLVLSPKTVAYHLGHVYAKLGVRSRSQLLARRPFDP